MAKNLFHINNPFYNYSSEVSKPDLRAALFRRLHKEIGFGQLRILTLLLVDIIFVGLAWLIAEEHGTPFQSPWNLQEHPQAMLVILVTTISLIASRGLYQSGSNRRDYFRLFTTLTFAQLFLVLVAFLYQPGLFVSRSTFLLSWLFSVLFVCTGRLAIDVTINSLRQRGTFRTPAFLICDEADRNNVLGIVGPENCYRIMGIEEASCLDRYQRQETINKMMALGVREVFIAWGAIKNRLFLYWLFQNNGITVHVLPADYKPIGRKLELKCIGGTPVLKYRKSAIIGTDFWFKRSFDFCFSALFVLLLFPIYICIGLLIKLDSPGPMLYKQIRIGLHGKPFEVWKFRTMRADADQLQKELELLNQTQDGVLFKIENDPRITRVGKVLRRYSLDELPQLFNVLRGDMSLVGPRPLPIRDIEKFSDYHFIRHEVLPGVTGLWQVSGRSDILSFEEVIKLDVAYIENWSLGLDFQILLRTIQVVLGKTGAY